MVNDVAKHIKLDLSRNRGTVVVYARYADTKTHNLHIAVTNNGNLVSLTDAVAAIMYIKLPSGTKYANSLVRIGNELRYTFQTQDLAEVGDVTAQVYVAYKDGSKFTTPEFTVEVYKNIDDLDVGSLDPESENTYQAVSDILSEANTTAELAQQTATTAKDNADAFEEQVETAEGYVTTTKEYMEATEALKDDVTAMKTSVESTKAAVETLKSDVEADKTSIESTKDLVEEDYSKVQGLATAASNSASEASEYASNSATSATSSATKAAESLASANTASGHAATASTYATSSKSYAVGGTGTRTGEDTDNANYYYEQAKKISEGLAGSLIPMGTITFAQLSSQTKKSGYMYNISDGFDSTTDFKDGGGIHYPAGTNVYCTSDEMWDCLAGATSTMDSALNTVTFTEATTRDNIATGESHMTIFGKIKKWFSSLGTAAFKDVTDDYSATGSDPVDGKAVASAISGKADSASTLAGYGIGDAYTKTETDDLLDDKATLNEQASFYGLEISHETPYIDFHFGKDSGDYTSRIIESSKGNLNVQGNLKLNGSQVLASSNICTDLTTNSTSKVASASTVYSLNATLSDLTPSFSGVEALVYNVPFTTDYYYTTTEAGFYLMRVLKNIVDSSYDNLWININNITVASVYAQTVYSRVDTAMYLPKGAVIHLYSSNSTANACSAYVAKVN